MGNPEAPAIRVEKAEDLFNARLKRLEELLDAAFNAGGTEKEKKILEEMENVRKEVVKLKSEIDQLRAAAADADADATELADDDDAFGAFVGIRS